MGVLSAARQQSALRYAGASIAVMSDGSILLEPTPGEEINLSGPVSIPSGALSLTGALALTGALTVGGQISAPSGTAAAPGLLFTDAGIYRNAAESLGFSTGGSLQMIVTGSSSSATLGLRKNTATLSFGTTDDATLARAAAGSMTFGGLSNGQLLGVKQLTELLTIAAAATSDTVILLPATAIVLGVSVRVTTIIPTAATFTVGDAGSAARFSTAAVTVAAGSTDPGTKAGAYYNATAAAVRITPNLTPGDTTGRVRVTIHYLDVTPPTS